MPDLQTEIFKKVLPNLNNLRFDDADDEETPVPTTTTAPEPKAQPIPLVRQIFEYIKEHPKCQGGEIRKVFTAAGYKTTVVAVSLFALVKTGRAVRVDGRLVVTRDSYDPPKRRVVKIKRVTKATPKPAPSPQKAPIIESKSDANFDIDVFMAQLSMFQGRELFNRLKAIYGG